MTISSSSSSPIKTMLEVYGNHLPACLTAATHAVAPRGDLYGSVILQHVFMALVIEAGAPQSAGTLVIAATDGKVLVEHRLWVRIQCSEGIPRPDAPSMDEVLWSICLDVRQAKDLAKALQRKTSEVAKKPSDHLDIRLTPADGGYAVLVSGAAGDWATGEDGALDGAPYPAYASALSGSDATDTTRHGVNVQYQLRLMRAMEPGFASHHKAVVTHKERSSVFTPIAGGTRPEISIRTRGLIMHVTI